MPTPIAPRATARGASTGPVTATLVDFGVHVTLYATGDSDTRAELCSVVAHGYEEDDSEGAAVSDTT